MSKAGYTFQVLKYNHDPAAGELLNIGAILYCPPLAFLGLQIERRFERLSQTFAGFDGESYRYLVSRFEAIVDKLREEYSQTLLGPAPSNVGQITAEIWPDTDLSLKLGPMLSGVTDDPNQALKEIFHRMIVSQYSKQEKPTRSDEEVWTIYKKPLLDRHLVSALRPKNISTPEFEIQFDYAFKNERWHVLQPVSLDLARPETVQKKAVTWLGTATALEGQEEMGRLFLLLGKPQQRSLRAAYDKAKSLLDRIPLDHDIVEEDQAESFAENFKKFVKKH
jgi:Protein of unknown function (DUF3037)